MGTILPFEVAEATKRGMRSITMENALAKTPSKDNESTNKKEERHPAGR